MSKYDINDEDKQGLSYMRNFVLILNDLKVLICAENNIQNIEIIIDMSPYFNIKISMRTN